MNENLPVSTTIMASSRDRKAGSALCRENRTGSQRNTGGLEKSRSYWYMNYYQDCNQPLLDMKSARLQVIMKPLNSSRKRAFACPISWVFPYTLDFLWFRDGVQ